MIMNSVISISTSDLTHALTLALRRNGSPKAEIDATVAGARLIVNVSKITKNFGIGPLSTNIDIGGEVHLHSETSPIAGAVALGWTVKNVPELAKPLVETFVHDALVSLDALREAVIHEHSRRGLLVVDPGKITINGAALGDVFNVTSVSIPGREGAALSIEGSLCA